MRFMAFLYADPDYYAGLSSDEMEEVGKGYGSFQNAFGGHISLSEGVYPDRAKTVSAKGGELVVSDGPIRKGGEEFGGVYLIECRDLEDAIAIVSKNPATRYGTVELWECTGPLLPPADDRYESEEKLDAYMEKVGVERKVKE